MSQPQPGLPLGPKPTPSLLKKFKSCGQSRKSCQKLGVVLEEKKWFKNCQSCQKMSKTKNVLLK